MLSKIGQTQKDMHEARMDCTVRACLRWGEEGPEYRQTTFFYWKKLGRARVSNNTKK